MYLLETVNIIIISLIIYELLSVEHGNPISHKWDNIIMCSFAEEKIQYIEYHKSPGSLRRHQIWST